MLKTINYHPRVWKHDKRSTTQQFVVTNDKKQAMLEKQLATTSYIDVSHVVNGKNDNHLSVRGEKR